MKVQYSILRYRSDIYIGENLNIAIAFHNLSTGERDYSVIPQMRRLWAFDDELDTEFTKISIEGFKADWEGDVNFNDYKDLEDFTSYFVNEFYHDGVPITETDNYEKFKKDTVHFYLSKSFARENRMNDNERNEYISEYLKSGSVYFRKQKGFKSDFGDELNFDYYLETEGNVKIAIKRINIGLKALSTLRSLLFYCEHNKLNLKIGVMLNKNVEKTEDKSYELILNLVNYGVEKGLIFLLEEDSMESVFSQDNIFRI